MDKPLFPFLGLNIQKSFNQTIRDVYIMQNTMVRGGGMASRGKKE